MRIVELGGNKLYIAEDAYDPKLDPVKSPEVDKYILALKGFLKSPLATSNANIFDLLLLKLSKKTIQRQVPELSYGSGFSLLVAHGGGSHPWRFFDKRQTIPVQDWIDEVDRESRAAFVMCCNSHNTAVRSTNAVVIHPRSLVSPAEVRGGFGNFRVYHPRKGYLN